MAINRRRFLHLAATSAVAPALIGRAAGEERRWRSGTPFTLGVAAGCPRPTGFVLWTRLAPEALVSESDLLGGINGPAIDVGYEIARDDAFRDIAVRGITSADPDFAYSVHLEVDGLEPGRPYWYRFMSGEAVSRTGRAMTAPAAGTDLDRLRFGTVSCSHYELGYFSPYRHLADEHPDLVMYLGDYIYEYIEKRHPTVRQHSDGVEATTLPTYRNRYAQYHTDPDLQRLRAEAPGLITWDDHEVENDYGDQWSATFIPPEQFLMRRIAAYRAFYEHMPLSPRLSRPSGPNMRIYDRFDFGTLARVSMLDGRQYRSRGACYGPPRKGRGHLETAESCPELFDESRSMIGAEQEGWLYLGLAQSPARWNILGQDVMMARLRTNEGDLRDAHWTDAWDGYPSSRARVLQHISDAKVSNPVVLSGDIHSYWTNDLKLDFDKPDSPVVATEFVGTSVTATPPPEDQMRRYARDNPHIRFFEPKFRGYVSVDLTRARMQTRYRTVSDVTDPQATVSTLKSYVVENGKPGAVEG
jgi:alkaline phosphatase D